MKKLAYKQTGISLLELMVSLGIGIILLLALASVYVTATQGNKIRSTDEEMDEIARQVFDRLQQDLNYAGYVDIFDQKSSTDTDLVASEVAKPTLSSVQAMYGRLMPTPASSTAPTPAPKTPIEIASSGSIRAVLGTEDSLTIAYQASAISNASHVGIEPRAGSGAIADCLGQTNALIDGKWIRNHYEYIDADNVIRCQSLPPPPPPPSSTTPPPPPQPQPIVEGIDEMQLRYLVTSPTTDVTANMYDSPAGLYVSNIMSAAEVADAARNPLGWAGVTGVEVCIVVAGEPISGRLSSVVDFQSTLPSCARDLTGNYTTKNRPNDDHRLYRRYVKVLTIPNALYFTE